jgi:hypothetical protein
MYSEESTEKMKKSLSGTSGHVPQDPSIDVSRAPIEELLSPDVFAELREDLKQDWLSMTRDQYRLQLVRIWSPGHPLHPERQMLKLDSMLQKNRSMLPCIQKGMEYLFCNKATAFYWTQSAQNRRDCGPLILGSIWNTWFGALDREPQVELDEFFAVPISVERNGPETISDLLRAHECLCAQVQGMLEEKRAEAGATPTRTHVWLDPRYFKLHPICEALIAVFDEYTVVAAEKHPDGFRHYDDVAQKQTILLVRTGNEDRLSTPISFDSLRHEAMPLARNDDMGATDIIRVPLQVGVRFVANLLCREEVAFPEIGLGGSTISNEPDHPATKWEREALDWAEEELAHEQERGAFSPFSSAATVRKAMQLHRPEEYPPGHFAPFPFRLGWI